MGESSAAPSSIRRSAHIYVTGDVIGVGFRAWMKIQAKIMGITGWVRNSFDKPDLLGASGGVEAVVCGSSETLAAYIARVRQGSPISHVEDVHIMWLETAKEYDGFEIRSTAHAASHQ